MASPLAFTITVKGKGGISLTQIASHQTHLVQPCLLAIFSLAPYILPQLLVAIQCVCQWLKAGFKRTDDRAAAAGDDDEIDRIYRVPEWSSNSEA
jgi:hypothetical protein